MAPKFKNILYFIFYLNDDVAVANYLSFYSHITLSSSSVRYITLSFDANCSLFLYKFDVGLKPECDIIKLVISKTLFNDMF